MRRHQRARRAVLPAAPDPATTTPGPAWPGVFLGAAPGGPLCAGPQQSTLVLGPPRSGKTTAVVVPNVLAAPGAVVATSTKTDVVELTLRARGARGRCWLFDPSGTVPLPAAMTQLCWSPVSGAEAWDEATATAHVMARAGRPGRGLLDADHWSERAEALLAPLLHAAALAGADVSTVLRWVLRRDLTEPMVLLARRGGDEFAVETLNGIGGTEERERSGIFSTAAGILAAYRSRAALDVAAAANFDVDAFVRSSDTVYICAEADAQEQLAPVVVTLLDRIKRAAYRREAGWPPLLWALDEAANIAPLPGLPSVVSEGGGQGLVSLVCLQDLSQAQARWGRAADGFLTLFSWKVVLPGIADYRTLQLVSALAGDADFRRESRTRSAYPLSRRPFNTVTTSWERRPVLPMSQVNQQQPGSALAIGPSAAPPRSGWSRAGPTPGPPTSGPDPDRRASPRRTSAPVSPDRRPGRSAGKPRRLPVEARTRPSPDDAHRVVFFQRHPDDDPSRAIPGRVLLNDVWPTRGAGEDAGRPGRRGRRPAEAVRGRGQVGGDEGGHDRLVRGQGRRPPPPPLPPVLPSRLRRRRSGKTPPRRGHRARQAVQDHGRGPTMPLSAASATSTRPATPLRRLTVPNAA